MTHKEYRSPLQQVMDKGWDDARGDGAVAYRDMMVKVREDDDRRRHRTEYRSKNAVWNGNDWIEP